MTQLLIHVADNNEEVSKETKFGGKPSSPNGALEWPVCKCCKGNMQFLGQLRTPESENMLLLFMCQNDPGSCDEWDPNGGGNAVVVIEDSKLSLVQPPQQGETTRNIRHGVKFVEHENNDYDASRAAWALTNGVSPREVLGQLGGTPAWIQGEETPTCDFCGEAMQFVAQLEQGPDWKTDMNFGGGGCAYVFQCSCNESSAKMLWQC
ncbi:hypothetical protein ACFQNF_19895 [Iodobacter arcticus]|uniref:DUF1963 domain-containing protein n=1 Tax=Iodobacter arcticus TaxID=590593 RepID=A0ABW2R344_9NEIS